MENLTLSHAVRYGKIRVVVITRERDETERNYVHRQMFNLTPTLTSEHRRKNCANILNHDILIYTEISSPYCAVNTLCLGYENQSVNAV